MSKTLQTLRLIGLCLWLSGCALDQGLVRPGVERAPVTQTTIAAGLKEALRVGTQRAVASTARPGGYLDNPLLRIALPDELNSAVDALRAVGLGSLVDRFETSMNRAAEQAADTAAPIFIDAISAMTLNDVIGIYRGGPTAATKFFRRRTERSLAQQFKPVIETNMNQVGVYQIYKDLVTPYQSLPFTGSINLDLADYITDRALDGLFLRLGQEEAKIRENPLSRTTELLRRVFG